jgi:hypothetical protein
MKFMCKNKFFHSSGMKTEFHKKFNDKNNNLTFKNLGLTK